MTAANGTLKTKLRYRFDNFMARGGLSIFISLTLTFFALLIAVSLIRAGVYFALGDSGASQEREVGLMRQIYIAFLGMTDPGNMNQDIESHWAYLIPAILAGLIGVIILSALIAFITTALDQKIQQLKKGHSKVVESDHTLILGWNERVIEILRELIIANESEDDACVVILSDLDKEQMDDYLSLHLKERGTTRIVTRSGSVSSLVNLEVVSIQTAKSIIALAYCDAAADASEKEKSDTQVIKTVLGASMSQQEGQELPIVAELFSDRSRDVAESISDEVTSVDAQDILAKVLVQTSRSVGLSVVYGEALSFDGCEMYFYDADWGDITFGQAQYHFPDGVPLGVRHTDDSIEINPPAEQAMREGDAVLILAEDDSTIEFQASPVALPSDVQLKSTERLQQSVERELIIGWNAKLPIIVSEYADYVLDGSKIDLLIHNPDEHILAAIAELQSDVENIDIRVIDKDPLNTETLLSMDPFNYDNIIILSQGSDGVSSETQDSQTIVILLLLRKIFADHPEEAASTKLITEVMDSDNQALVARAGVNDFIISNRFVSMILAQLSEEPDMKRVYDDLFSEDGSEIYLKPVEMYLDNLPNEHSFADMMAVAQQREEVCIGVKIAEHEHDMAHNFGVKLIPEKDKRYTLKPGDRLIVVSEDET